MSTSQNDSGDQKVPPTKSTVVLLLGTIGDTTWRMFIPTIGFTIIGVIIDNMLKSKPWGTIIGIVIGVALATLLVYRQLKKVQR